MGANARGDVAAGMRPVYDVLTGRLSGFRRLGLSRRACARRERIAAAALVTAMG